jgi:cytochrome b subunit of formate dehydrogenase
MRKKMFYFAPLALVGIAVFIVIGGEIVMRLWNWLTPELFGWRQINFWQAFGLLALCRILFGGLGMRGSMRSNMRRRMSERWSQRMSDRWERMTPEEREKFRNSASGRCGPFEPPAATPTT